MSPLSLSAPCASLLKLRTLLKRTLNPGREGGGKLGQLKVCPFLSIRSRLLNWDPLTSWGPWSLKFLAKFCLCVDAFLRGEGPFLSSDFSKGSVDSKVKHSGTKCRLLYVASKYNRKSEMQREVGWWVSYNPRQAITRSLSHLREIYFRCLWHLKQPSKAILSIFSKEQPEARRGDGRGDVCDKIDPYNQN